MAKKYTDEELLDACISYSKEVKNYTTSSEFEKSKFVKPIWKKSGLARIVNQILLVLNKAIDDGIYSKEVVNRRHFFILDEIESSKPEEEEEEEEKEEEVDEDEEEDEDEDEEEEEEMQEAIDDVVDEELDDDGQAMEKFAEETGLSAMTKKGTIRKDYTKWKKSNWN